MSLLGAACMAITKRPPTLRTAMPTYFEVGRNGKQPYNVCTEVPVEQAVGVIEAVHPSHETAPDNGEFTSPLHDSPQCPLTHDEEVNCQEMEEDADVLDPAFLYTRASVGLQGSGPAGRTQSLPAPRNTSIFQKIQRQVRRKTEGGLPSRWRDEK